MSRIVAGFVGALALLLVLALPSPAAAAQPRADGVANGDQLAEFSSRQRRSHVRHYGSARYGAAPCYYRPYRSYEFPYHYYYRPYRCFGAPYEVPVYVRARY